MRRAELFALALERATTYLDRLRPGWRAEGLSAPELTALLELWYLRTRFAYRLPLEAIVAALGSEPASPLSAERGDEPPDR